ncbi:hypothetical protein L6164_016677 [Bauhinia variegata]|uniref:Uncharacterized protein n=1 Tax=Bauhinia variegata TaxID=167791 RepID=A0ACB9NPD9_BAUVA|nr:hypothetical protein L6164_016677 [Bauhinia variegata]
MKALWDELASYHEPLCCNCGGLKALAEREEKERVMQFLMRLNESYSIIRGSILMMRPLPDTRKAHALLLQQERQVDVATKRETNVSHHAMQSSHAAQLNRAPTMQENRPPKRQLKCSYCERDGHLIDRCFYLHGFPVGHKLHGRNVKPKVKKPTAHNVQVDIAEPPKGPTTGGAMFTIEEYNQLMACFAKEMVTINHLQMSQDVVMKKTIGLGKQYNGLYYLQISQNPHLVHSVKHSSSLWHQRLGHPSSDPLQELSKHILEIFFDS